MTSPHPSLAANRLFAGLSPEQLEPLSKRTRLLELGDGEAVVRRGDRGQEVFLVLEGELDVVVDERLGAVVATLGAGEWFGEGAAFTGRQRGATVRSRGAAVVGVLDLGALAGAEPGFDGDASSATGLLRLDSSPEATVARVLLNLTRGQIERLERSNAAHIAELQARLEEEQDRRRLGVLLVVVICLVSAYAYTIGAIDALEGKSLELTSLGVALGAAGGALVAVRLTRASAASMGLTWLGLVRGLRAALLWSLAMIVGMTALKAVLVGLLPDWSGLPVLHSPLHVNGTWGRFALFSLLYGVSSVVQEFAARSFLHTGFERLLVGRESTWLAIALSNLVFSVFHLHYSVVFALITGLSGAIYGAFWVKHRSLPAIATLHAVTGIWAMDILALFTLPGLEPG